MKRYYVNWDDQHFPRIHVVTQDTPDYYDRLTLAQAKAEIIEKFTNNIADAREYIKEVRSWRAADIEPED